MEALSKEINNVPMPDRDPVFGANGPLNQIWISARTRARAMI